MLVLITGLRTQAKRFLLKNCLNNINIHIYHYLRVKTSQVIYESLIILFSGL